MALVRAQVSFPLAGSDGADVTMNTWGFDVDAATTAGVTNAQAALDAFYTTLNGLFSSQALWNQGTVKWYNMGDSPPRAPFAETIGTFATGAGVSPGLPAECCMCLSFQGIRLSGVPQARRRGRVYLGPLAVSAIGSTGLLTASALSTADSAATTLLAAGPTAGDFDWVILSPTGGLDAVIVANGWIDNAIDIQRRRGLTATSRSIFP